MANNTRAEKNNKTTKMSFAGDIVCSGSVTLQVVQLNRH